MNKKFAGLIKLVDENPDLAVKFMVNYEVCASDDHTYWLADIASAEVDEIYDGNHGHGDDETIYIRSLDEETLVDYIAEHEFEDADIETAYSEAEKIVKDLAWQKVILVYIDVC